MLQVDNSEATSPRRRLLPAVAAATVGGWVVHDLLVVAGNWEPYLVVEFLAGSVLAVLAGALFGLAWSRAAILPWLAVAVCGAGILAASVFRLGLPVYRLQFLQALLELALGAALALWLGRRGLPTLRLAYLAGVLGGFLMMTGKEGVTFLSSLLLASAALTVAAAYIPSRPARRLVTSLVLIAPLVAAGVSASRRLELRRADREQAPSRPAAGAPNLVLISLDTVRARSLAPYGHDRVTTPGLDAFVGRHAVIYDQARSTSSWTLPSHASIFTGLLPSDHGAVHPRGSRKPLAIAQAPYPTEPLRAGIPTLAERLAAAGYRTAAVVANHVYLAHDFGVDRGFEHYDDRFPIAWRGRFLTLVQLAGFKVEVGQLNYRDARTITDLALRRIDRLRGSAPFFLFVNYMDAHHPYLSPRRYASAFADEQPADPLDPPREMQELLYERELLYLDDQLTRFLDGLEERGLLDDTVVVVTSDHGEAFGEHGFWLHDKTLYEEVIRVPLYVKRLRSAGAGTRIARSVTGADVLSLVLGELNLGPGELSPEGDVIAEWFASPAVTRAHRHAASDVDRDLVVWLQGSRKFIVGSKQTVEIYDLEHDPAESNNLAGDDDASRRSLLRAASWWEQHPPLVTGDDREQLDPELLEHLRNLGYLD